jgi:hypothetical protein
VTVGSLISAAGLQLFGRQQFVLVGGFGWTLNAILGSTPFRDYAVREGRSRGV